MLGLWLLDYAASCGPEHFRGHVPDAGDSLADRADSIPGNPFDA